MIPEAYTIARIGWALLGATVAGYWYRVLRMAAKARRRTGHAANLVPPEPLGRLLRLPWAPAIVVWIVQPWLAALASRLPAALAPIGRPSAALQALVAWLCAAIALACLAATLLCWARMGRSWRMGIDPGEKTRLIADGPFAYVRHPIYALSTIMILATTLAIPSPLMLAAAAIHIGLLVFESLREERNLLAVHGSAYARYCDRVGRFVPASLRAYDPAPAARKTEEVGEIRSAPVRLNAFQRLARDWDEIHPYNAAQSMRLRGPTDEPAIRRAWATALSEAGLGRVVFDDRAGRSFHYEPIDAGQAAAGVRTLCAGVDLSAHLSAELNRRFDDPAEPPFRPFLIPGAVGEETYRIGIVYQHWVADSCAIRLLMAAWLARLRDPSARIEPLAQPGAGYWALFRPAAGSAGVAAIAGLVARHWRYRQARKVRTLGPRDYPTRVLIPPPCAPGLLERLLARARAHDLKLNDLLLASLAQACDEYVPTQPRRKRTRTALATIVDLRPYSARDLSNCFGLFLGFTETVFGAEEIRDFDRLAKSAGERNRRWRRRGSAPASLAWMGAALALRPLVAREEIYHFYRKESPLLGGISNVNLDADWPGRAWPALLLDYDRVSPTGPMTPLVLAVTTLGGRLRLSLTCRETLLSESEAARLLQSVITGLERAASGTTPSTAGG